jgi:nucleotide-binding universal stress UspA family protein
MKTILIPTEDHASMPAVLETARLIAQRFGSYMEGFAVYPAAADFVAVDPVSSLTIASMQEGDEEIERLAQGLFESFMQAHAVPSAHAVPKLHAVPNAHPVPNVHPVPSADRGPAAYSYGWIRPGAHGDALIGSHGRMFDLIVMGRPGRAPQDPRMPPLEAALFESGRPVLIAPASAPQVVGGNVLVAWNGSTEQTRTTAFALPLLREAREVTVLSVEGGMTPGPTGEEFAHYLRSNAVAATAVTAAPGTRTTGETILDHAKTHGCDLLVKGAYTQSRLRQMVFGGATRHILASATLPVLMAH